MQEHREEILLEPFFLFAYWLGMSWETYYNFPVSYKHWLAYRLKDEVEKQNQDNNDMVKEAQKGGSGQTGAMPSSVAKNMKKF